MHDEELGAVGVWSSVGHGDGATSVLAGERLISKSVARSTSTITFGVTALNHETFNDAVKDGVVIEVIISKINKVIDGDGGVLSVKRDNNVSLISFKSGEIGFLGVDLHGGLRKVGWLIGGGRSIGVHNLVWSGSN